MVAIRQFRSGESQNITIRLFSSGDLPYINDMVVEAFNESYDTNMYYSLYSQWPEGFLISELNGIPVGFVLGTVSSPNEARILMIAVKSHYRSMGVGSILMNQFTQNSIMKGLKRMTLEVRVSNTRAMNFYYRLGFAIVGKIPHYYKDGEDGYVMERIL